MTSPLVYLTIAFSLGITLGRYFSQPVWLSLSAASIFLLLTIYAWINKLKLTGFILILAFLAGLLCFQIRNLPETNRLSYYLDQGYVTLTGEVSGDRRDSSFPLTVGGETITVYLDNCSAEVEYGDQVRVQGSLRESTGFANPLLPAAKKYLSLYATGYEKLSGGGGNPFVKLAIYFNRRFNETLLRILPPEQAELLGSILLGSTVSPIAAETKSIYRQAGLIHLLVVSGTQVSIMIGVCLGLCRCFNLPLAFSVALTSFINLMLVLSTGGGASILRAAIMGEMALIGLLFERDKEFYTALSLAALILLIIDPSNLFDIGFQLSFAATWGLVYITPALGRGLLATSLAPLLATAPLIYYYFSQISPGALLSNLLVLPWMEILVIFGLAVVLLGFIFLPLAQLFGVTLWLLLKLLDLIAQTVAGLPGAFFYWPAPSLPLIIGYYVILIIMIELAKQGRLWQLTLKRGIFAGGLIAVIIIWQLAAAPEALGGKELTVTFLDVGQGDSILIETPNGKNILVDGGGKETGELRAQTSVGEKVVVPFLQRKGINKLALVVLTHPHLDHFGGLISVLEKIKVENIIGNGEASDSSAYRRFKELIRLNKIKYQLGRAGEVIDFGANVKAFVLNPVGIIPGRTNSNSVVLRLLYNQVSFLLTGDLEQDGEEGLAGFPLRSSILKVGHHGSRTATSDEFLDAVNPRLAVISAGRHNRYRHPHQATINKLLARGIKIYRTDRDGAITIKTDGYRLLTSPVVQNSSTCLLIRGVRVSTAQASARANGLAGSKSLPAR